MIVLPRQARDKHREDSKTKTVFSGVCLADDLGGSEINTCTDNPKAKCDVWNITAAGHTVKERQQVYYQECLLRSTSLLH